MEKQTPLHSEHIKLGAKMLPFAGYDMPIQYSDGIIKEHLAVRTHVGIFDVSHMGEILIKGDQARSYLDRLLSSDLSKLQANKIKYAILCDDQGYSVDDLLVYCISDTEYLLVVNASNKDKDYQWLFKHRIEGVTITDLSDDYALIALQGPESEAILKKITEVIPTKKYTFIKQDILGTPALISRTGYTGEDGFEIYLNPADAAPLWNTLIDLGAKPCGLGARDTLRLEAGMPLYGHELSDKTTALDADLDFFVDFSKDFIGKDKIQANTQYKLIGFEILGKGIAREGTELLVDDQAVGYVTSGTFSPSLETGIGLALVDKTLAIPEEFTLSVRGRKLLARQASVPFIKKGGKKNG